MRHAIRRKNFYLDEGKIEAPGAYWERKPRPKRSPRLWILSSFERKFCPPWKSPREGRDRPGQVSAEIRR